MRLIDADKLKWDFNVYIPAGVPQNFVDTICNMVDAQPTIEAEQNSCEYWDSESHFCALRRPQAEPITLERAIDCLRSIGWMQEHDRILTESAVPIKHGRWIEVQRISPTDQKAICECSLCGDTVWVYDGQRSWNYCPNCGAKMDEVEE